LYAEVDDVATAWHLSGSSVTSAWSDVKARLRWRSTGICFNRTGRTPTGTLPTSNTGYSGADVRLAKMRVVITSQSPLVPPSCVLKTKFTGVTPRCTGFNGFRYTRMRWTPYALHC
jgi:hypothetical protein